MTRHMFAGGTTPVGFVSFFDQIMPLEKAKKRIFLKGSSGGGKSTFMKKIASGFESAGMDIDIYHCANDADSLDGLSAGAGGLSVIDGTAPHVYDPELPIAIDSIIDFAGFIDGVKASPYAEEIKALLRKKKIITDKARGYLTAAGNVYKAEIAAYESALKSGALAELTREWVNTLWGADAGRSFGSDRKMFLTAITPDGVISYADTVIGGCKIYGLTGETSAGMDMFLAGVKAEARSRGINTESFYCPLEPNRLEYLLLKEIKTAFAVAGGYYCYDGRMDETIDFSGCFDARLAESAGIATERNRDLTEGLLKESVALMKESRELHLGIEKIYIGAMEFNRVNDMTDRVMRELLQ